MKSLLILDWNTYMYCLMQKKKNLRIIHITDKTY